MRKDCIVVSENEFSTLVGLAIAEEPMPDFIVGPGRSGAVASVYVSYRMHRPFVPYGHAGGPKGSTVLIVDTVSMTGGTIRKARARYERMGFVVRTLTIVPENRKRHHFWFEYANDQNQEA